MRLFMLILTLVALFLFFPTRINARSWTLQDGCPDTIKTVISSDPCKDHGGEYCSDKPTYDNMEDLHFVLSNCPNITRLDLRVTGLGCSQWPSRWNFPFNPAGGEVYPRLQSLRLEGYRFNRELRWFEDSWRFPENRYGYTMWMEQILTWLWRGDYKTWLEWKRLPAEQQSKSNFALWLDAMDWSGIEELWIDGVTDEIIEKLPGRLASLHTLESSNRTFIEQFQNNTIKNLTWVDWAEYHDLPAILSRQGQSLQSLEFRCPEMWCMSFPHQFDIKVLPNATENLTHLSINVPRNGTWPLESFETIASLPHLRKADLYLKMRAPCREQMPEPWGHGYDDWEREHGRDYCKGEDQYQKPLLSGSSALELVKYMKAKNEGGELEEVVFWVGDWSRPYDGPLWEPPWLDGRRAKVVCKLGSSKMTEPSCVVEEGDNYWKGGKYC